MILSTLVFLPLVSIFTIFCIKNEKWIRPVALGYSLVSFILSLCVLIFFDSTSFAVQFVERRQWIPQMGIEYFLGIDGLSLWLVMLAQFLLPLVIVGSWDSIKKQPKVFYSALFLLQTSMLGSFLSLDLVLFYVFFESSLIPMALMIGIWGGDRKIYASFKFFIYTMLGSVFMLASIVCLMILNKIATGSLSSNVLDLYQLDISFVAGRFFSMQTLLFFGFIVAFAVKIPMFPVHTWLPDAHVQAPTPGSVLLAGVMLKMGTYGIMRFVIPMFPEAAEYFSWLFMLVAIVGIVYGALVAMVQTDIKKLVAYSSISHMGYVLLGLFALNLTGGTGSLYQMLNHGISTGALFFLVGMIYERTHTRDISFYGGLAQKLPYYSIVFFIVVLSSIAVPLTNGFVGEFLILLGAFQNKPFWGALAALGVILGAIYMLWMVKKVFYGEESAQLKSLPLKDLQPKEWGVLVPLIIMIFWMGLFPQTFLKFSRASLNHYFEQSSNYTLPYYSRSISNKTQREGIQ